MRLTIMYSLRIEPIKLENLIGHYFLSQGEYLFFEVGHTYENEKNNILVNYE